MNTGQRFSWVLGLCAMVMSCMSSADQNGTPSSIWSWESPSRNHRQVVIRFVRGSIEVRRRDGPVRVEVIRSAHRSDPFEAAIVVSQEADGITISDRYPARSGADYRECLPPVDARGDFWSSDVRLTAVVRAPQSLPVRVELTDDGPISSSKR
jgi:hypothetical protein